MNKNNINTNFVQHEANSNNPFDTCSLSAQSQWCTCPNSKHFTFGKSQRIECPFGQQDSLQQSKWVILPIQQ